MVNECGEVVNSRIGKTKHITDFTIIVEDPYHNICLDKTRNLSLRYVLGELKWYLSGSNKVADIGPYAKMWYALTDDGETVNSAYGYRIFHKFGFDQLQYCIDKLKSNPYDRQCVIHIKEASNTPTKDTPCTCLLQFTCENGMLNLHTYMRSNDIWLGLPYDMAFFTVLLQIVANEIGMYVGRYYHTVGDLHLYERHWDKDIVCNSYDIEATGWDYTMETPESFESALAGNMPDNLLLRQLWRINNENKR
jgi:thymidylate synthase